MERWFWVPVIKPLYLQVVFPAWLPIQIFKSSQKNFLFSCGCEVPSPCKTFLPKTGNWNSNSNNTAKRNILELLILCRTNALDTKLRKGKKDIDSFISELSDCMALHFLTKYSDTAKPHFLQLSHFQCSFYLFSRKRRFSFLRDFLHSSTLLHCFFCYTSLLNQKVEKQECND